MRRFRLFMGASKRGKTSSRSWTAQPRGGYQRKEPNAGLPMFEKIIIRAVILSAVLLVTMQMGLELAKNPVDYYISVAQNVEAPSLESTPVSSTVTPNLIQDIAPQTSKILLKAVPAAPVRVLQNGKVLGSLARGELEVPVHAGVLQLDGTNVSAIVRVQVMDKDMDLIEPRLNQTVMIEHNIQTLRIKN
ncbi:hypothetical protein [Desulfitobacterium sp. THU1]|uniref:hypothetical protein n=1 Tax=Desulfitobacterium sp. THU1 TaxID=3138072 RepID=UPI00404B3AA8